MFDTYFSIIGTCCNLLAIYEIILIAGVHIVADNAIYF